ncbi:MAG: hypothetical protein OHK0039_29090 [Bacteroidia bacterium]
MQTHLRHYLLPLMAGVVILVAAQWLSHRPLPPRPTDRADWHEESETHKRDREAWIAAMHRAAPGVDWQAMDKQTRWQLAQERFRRRRATRSTAADFAKDTFAGGQLVGHWREFGSSNQAGRVHLAEYDPATGNLYLGTSGGIVWRGPLDGSDWQPRNDLLRIDGMEFLRKVDGPNGPRLLAGATGWGEVGFRYSDDEGLTWTFATGLDATLSWGRLLRAAMTADSLPHIYVLTLEWDNIAWEAITAFYRSDDLGESFVRIGALPNSLTGGENYVDIWTDRYTPSPVLMLADHVLYRLDQPGGPVQVASFSTTTGGTGARLRGRLGPGGLTLYALYTDDNLSYVYRSTDGGQAWGYRGTVSSGLFFRTSFEVSRLDPNRLFVGGINAYRSSDGGQSWTLVNEWWEYYGGNEATKLHADIPAFNSFTDSSGQEFTLISTDGGLYVSRDGLQTVQNISLSGLHVSQYYSTYTLASNPATVFAGSQDQGYQRSMGQDRGGIMPFVQIISGDYGHLTSSDGGQRLWMNYPGFTQFYPQAPTSGYGFGRNFDGSGHLWLPPLLADPQNPNVAYLGGGSLDGQGANLIKLTAANDQVTPQELPHDFSEGTAASISAIAISPLDADRRYVMTDNGRFFTSGDGGQIWLASNVAGLPGSHYFYGNALLPSPVSDSRVYVAGSGYSNAPVFRSDNYGATFTAISNGLPSTLVFDLAATPDERYLFAATEVGPFVYVVADNQWHYLGARSAPDQTYWTVEYVDSLHAARFGTHGRGIWDFNICDDASPLPLAGFTLQVDTADYRISATNTSAGAYFFRWELSDGSVYDAQDLTHTFPGPGYYIVRLTASTHCLSNSSLVVVELPEPSTAIDPGRDMALRVYPNPAQGAFFVDHRGTVAGVRLLSLQGQVLREVARPQLPLRIDVAGLARGLYLVELRDEQQRRSVQKVWVD